MKTVTLTCFTDVLCVWAWIGELRLAEVRRTHGEAVAVTQRFCNVFGATALKIQANWGAKGGYDGFAGHLAHVLEGFPELTASPDLWRRVRPASSLPAHLALKAVQAQAAEGGAPDLGDRSILLIRRAFSSRDGISRRPPSSTRCSPPPALTWPTSTPGSPAARPTPP